MKMRQGWWLALLAVSICGAARADIMIDRPRGRGPSGGDPDPVGVPEPPRDKDTGCRSSRDGLMAALLASLPMLCFAAAKELRGRSKKNRVPALSSPTNR